jgi:anthranilate synthase component I
MTFDRFQNLAKTYTAIPVSRRLLADVLTPVSLFLTLRKNARYPFLLESVEGGEHLARYSFLGKNPYQILTFDGELVYLERNGESIKQEGSYFDVLRHLTSAFREPDLPNLPRLTGGAVGFSSYDTIREMEYLPDVPPSDINLPEAIWAFYDEIIAFDHVKKQLVLMKTVFTDPGINLEEAYSDACRALDELEASVKTPEISGGNFQLDSTEILSNVSKSRFKEMVETAKEYIFEGDIFQVVLSQRFQVPFKGDQFMLYRALRMVNPSPYLFYLDFEDFSLIGSSPEVLVRVQQGIAQLLPIAGTRPRGKGQGRGPRTRKRPDQRPKRGGRTYNAG